MSPMVPGMFSVSQVKPHPYIPICVAHQLPDGGGSAGAGAVEP